ncbi:hypothetical protein N3K63_00230 [Microbacterium sp. W1N]|uniref:hypothetical protein n=1 Tax=Microbacterium festucae TaxID=2977531 RepID=UPI0021C1DF83|nr:hypothetical protein [Microbacterium festucae]MCT9818701.1 hypothetical protein [Microbacterium festucae]
MSRRAVLWIAFAVVHLGVAWLGWLMPNEPMGDVYRVYEPWSAAALEGAGIVGIHSAWVYPQLALVPMLIAQPLGVLTGSYIVGWALLVTAVDAAAFAVLVGRGSSQGRQVAAWFWLAAIVLLGPVGLYRLDGITVALAVLGCLWLVRRPAVAAVLLAAATWMKVWPAALLAAAVIALRRRLVIIAGALAVSALTLLLVVAAGGLPYAFGFLTEQTSRGLQVEAPVSAFYLWGALLEVPGFWVYYDPDILTFQVTGSQIDPVIAVMTPVLVAAIVAVAALGAVKAARGATVLTLLPALSLALVVGFIAFNKVGSPQYICWLFPSVILGLVLDRRAWLRPALLVLVTAALTQIVYPMLYNGILYPEPVAVTVLTVRNILLVGLFVWMVVRLARVRPPVRRPATVAA